MNQVEAFLLTLALEAPIAALIVARMKARIEGRIDGRIDGRIEGQTEGRTLANGARGAISAVVGSTMTHPFVWLANERWARQSVDWGWAWKIALIELGAVLVETLVYARVARVSLGRAAAASAIVNAFSFGMGLLIWFALWRWR